MYIEKRACLQHIVNSMRQYFSYGTATVRIRPLAKRSLKGVVCCAHSDFLFIAVVRCGFLMETDPLHFRKTLFLNHPRPQPPVFTTLPRVPKRPTMNTRPAPEVPSKRPRTDGKCFYENARLVEVVNSYSAPAFDLPPEIIPEDVQMRTVSSNNPNSLSGKDPILKYFFYILFLRVILLI
jgi:hypothetical protein